MTRRVLLTGATGLIGRPTVTALNDLGFEVIAFSRSGNVKGAHQTIVADILDPVSRRRAVKNANASHLIHLAWYDTPKTRWSAPENLDWAAATLGLVREFADNGGKRAVCVGSCAEYDWSQEVLSEATPLKPASLYGKAKAATGTLLSGAANDLGISLAWARIFFCYGPGEPKGRLLGDLLTGLSKGQVVPCTDGLQERDFLHTGDIARALVAVLSSDLQGPVNIASGDATPVRRLIEETAKQMGRSELVEFGAIKRPADDPKRIVADVSKLSAIGFRPRFNIVDGVADCIEKLNSGNKK